ncbi:MAG: hypothetical protein RLZZ238_991 [Planctomycetota bacterium]|jgi:hypothetical protein
MKVVPVARLAVPTGTAAGTVVASQPSADPVIESRRFAALAAQPAPIFRAAFEELIVAGVYTVLADRVLVLRVSRDGTRRHAAVVAIGGAPAATVTPSSASGLDASPFIAPGPTDTEAHAAFLTALEAETKRRPVFHGTAADGTTYSGFEAEATAEILDHASRSLAEGTTPHPLAMIFAGDPTQVPAGIAVVLHSAKA